MTPTASSTEGPQDNEIDLLDLLQAIWAGKLWVAVAVVLSLGIGVIGVLKTQPIYQAKGLLQLESRSGGLGLPLDMLGNASSEQSSGAEMEILKSRMVMSQAVRELGLQVYAYPRPLPYLGLIPARLNLADPGLGILRPYQWGNEEVRLGELEVPQEWLGKSMTLTITDDGTYRITLPDARTADGTLRERLALPEQGFSLVVDEL